MSVAAREALAVAADSASRYPDNDCFGLLAALSNKLDVPPDWLVLGHGSECVLGLAATAFLEPGKHALYSQYSFQAFINSVQRTGAGHKVVTASDYGCDLDAMADVIEDETGLIYIANPGNPTGSFLSGPLLERFISSVPSNIPILLDEAYCEYLFGDDEYDSVNWVRRFPNLIVTRTFSKAYGLAGLRIGYGIAQASLTSMLNRIRPAFVVTEQAERAAIAALGDDEFLMKTRAANRDGLAQLYAGLELLGLTYLRSRGNFVLVRVGDASAVNASLLRQSVIVRPVGVYGLPEWIRISVGTEAENNRCLSALRTAILPSK
jgi:histidinol-phosphate aminotransferase